MANYKKKY